MTSPAPLPRRPLPTVRRSTLQHTVDRFTGLPQVRLVELVMDDGGVAYLTVHWTHRPPTRLIVTEDVDRFTLRAV